MRQLVAALAAALAACTPGQVQVATDLLTPPAARCREAQDIYAELTGTPAEMARWRLYVLVACLGGPASLTAAIPNAPQTPLPLGDFTHVDRA